MEGEAAVRLASTTSPEVYMVLFCTKILSLFLIPFQTIFVDSVFGSFVFVVVMFLPFVMVAKIWRSI